MTEAECFNRVAVFIGLVGAFYGMAFVLLIGVFIEKRSGNKLSKPWLYFRRTVFAGSILGVFCIAYGYFVEPYWLEVTHVEIRSPRIAASEHPIRLALISDLHCDRRQLREEDLQAVIQEQHPDLILFTGDSANRQEEIPRFQRIMQRISKVAPIYGVKGNWDTGHWTNIPIFQNTDVHEMNERTEKLNIRGQTLLLSGLDFGNEERLDRMFKDLSGSLSDNHPFHIFLYHSPDLAPDLATRGVDLFCAGHTHGGQVALPFYGAVITLCKLGKEYEAGKYKRDTMNIYVNRGIGVDGWGPRVRFLARPEVTVIDLVHD